MTELWMLWPCRVFQAMHPIQYPQFFDIGSSQIVFCTFDTVFNGNETFAYPTIDPKG